ncbi:MAG: hypothetical protein IKI21_12930 [Oscillospiraceae bacterium]|nr:hypothetical protein [Oscillospiraceae bacterium]
MVEQNGGRQPIQDPHRRHREMKGVGIPDPSVIADDNEMLRSINGQERANRAAAAKEAPAEKRDGVFNKLGRFLNKRKDNKKD